MKYKDPEADVKCAQCGHKKEVHMIVCGDRDCACLCFVPEGEEQDSISFDHTALGES